MSNTFLQFKVHFAPGGGRRETKGGVQYAVYPAVLLVEGVHHCLIGNPTMYPKEVLEASAPDWNNMPVCINHPMQGKEYVSIKKKPGAAIGYLDGVTFEDNRLKGSVFLDVGKTHREQPGLLNGLDSGTQLDVSTGLFGEAVREDGSYNGKQYSERLTVIYPDHLALLPGGQGACSWADGCGVRANEGSGEQAYIPQTIFSSFKNNIGGNEMMNDEPYLVPRLFGENKNQSAVDRAIAHINEKHGAAAPSKIRNMSGADLLLLGRKLQRDAGQESSGAAHNNDEAYTPPVLFGGAR